MEAGLKQNKIDALRASFVLFRIRTESLMQIKEKEKVRDTEFQMKIL